MPTYTQKRSTTFRLSEEARSLLEELARHHGIAQTAALEMAIRLLARRDVPDYRPSADKPTTMAKGGSGKRKKRKGK